MKLLRFIKALKTFLINVMISFALFSIHFVALSAFTPFINLASHLQDNYIYSYNKNYDELYSKEELSYASYYYFEHEGEETILYLNENGLNSGIPTFYFDYILLLFPVQPNNSVQEYTRYSLEDLNIRHNGEIKTSIGQAIIDIDYIVIDNSINDNKECHYFIYPPNQSSAIKITDGTGDGFICLRGSDIKRSILWNQSTVGQVLILLTVVPMIILLLSSFFYFDFEVMKEKDYIYINYVFYKKKVRIMLKMLLALFCPTLAAYLTSCYLSYSIFLRSNIMFFFIPAMVIGFLIFIYSLAVTHKIVNKIIKRRGVEYVD